MPDSPWLVAGPITAIGLLGFLFSNHVDLSNYPKWGWPWWMAIPVALALLGVSYVVPTTSTTIKKNARRTSSSTISFISLLAALLDASTSRFCL